MAMDASKEHKAKRRRMARGKPLAVDVEANRGYGDERYEERDERRVQLDEGPAPEEPRHDGDDKHRRLRPLDEAARSK